MLCTCFVSFNIHKHTERTLRLCTVHSCTVSCQPVGTHGFFWSESFSSSFLLVLLLISALWGKWKVLLQRWFNKTTTFWWSCCRIFHAPSACVCLCVCLSFEMFASQCVSAIFYKFQPLCKCQGRVLRSSLMHANCCESQNADSNAADWHF